VEEGVQKGIREPLVEKPDHQLVHASKGHPWMVYFCTFVAVCGSYEFGACVSVWFVVELYVTQITLVIPSKEDVVKLKSKTEALLWPSVQGQRKKI